jgi:hypothetical protein
MLVSTWCWYPPDAGIYRTVVSTWCWYLPDGGIHLTPVSTRCWSPPDTCIHRMLVSTRCCYALHTGICLMLVFTGLCMQMSCVAGAGISNIQWITLGHDPIFCSGSSTRPWKSILQQKMRRNKIELRMPDLSSGCGVGGGWPSVQAVGVGIVHELRLWGGRVDMSSGFVWGNREPDLGSGTEGERVQTWA